MAIDINRCVCTGYLTRDVTLGQTKGEEPIPVANMGLAVNLGKRGGEDQPPMFLEVACFGGQAPHCAKFLSKGSRVAIDGRLDPEEWQARDGSPRRQIKVIAQTVTFLDRPPKDEGDHAEDGSAASKNAAGNGSQAKRTGGRGRSRKDGEPAGAAA